MPSSRARQGPLLQAQNTESSQPAAGPAAVTGLLAKMLRAPCQAACRAPTQGTPAAQQAPAHPVLKLAVVGVGDQHVADAVQPAPAQVRPLELEVSEVGGRHALRGGAGGTRASCCGAACGHAGARRHARQGSAEGGAHAATAPCSLLCARPARGLAARLAGLPCPLPHLDVILFHSASGGHNHVHHAVLQGRGTPAWGRSREQRGRRSVKRADRSAGRSGACCWGPAAGAPRRVRRCRCGRRRAAHRCPPSLRAPMLGPSGS